VLIESGINCVEVANEAAFYGPKIDVQVWRCLHTATTIATQSEPDGRGLLRARWWPSARTSA
jgi:threonyl-tRNA synthetase